MVKSVYIHIPFCKNICSYCDFCKVFYNKNWVYKYLESLDLEVKMNYKGECLDTIYIGGGTPSSLDINELNKLFKITNTFNLEKDYEFTIECNIEDITIEKLKLFKKNKINRLSIGVESFSSKCLRYLGRNYTKSKIKNKINLAKKYFNNINIDLIYALPYQTLSEFEDDINNALELDVNHISCYSLMIEKNTKLYIDNQKNIDPDLDYEMYKFIDNRLKEKYVHYEISNYAKKGFESKHNLTYWLNKEYYGFGISASGYIDNIRYTNTKSLTKYINNSNERENEIVDEKEKMKYELILGFRLKRGINKKEFYNKYNIDIHEVKNINKLIREGYLIDNKDNIFVKEKYLYVLNDILVNFV